MSIIKGGVKESLSVEVVIRESLISGGGEGLFATNFIANGKALGKYGGYIKPSNRLTVSEMDYSIALADGASIVGTGVLAKINDTVDLRVLTGEEVRRLLSSDSVVPRHCFLEHNVRFRCGLIENQLRVDVVAVRDISPGEELYVDYGVGYWIYKFALMGFLPGREDVSEAVKRFFVRVV